MPKIVNTVGLEMPDDFPVDAYNAVHSRVGSKRAPHPLVWPEWAGGWNALAYRFQSVADHDVAFTDSLKRFGDSPPPPERYFQEKELFGFFVAGLAAIDSFAYGLYAVASMIDNTNFPLDTSKHKQSVSPETTERKFRQHFSGDDMTKALEDLLADPEFQKWKGFRNVLAHRATPGRVLTTGGIGGVWKDVEIPTGKETFTFDTKATGLRRAWLAKILGQLVPESDAFLGRNGW